jgi:Tat protein translocase TatB subunit
MFNVGGGEILVILLLALIVLGPQRLPGAARQVGKAMGELRRVSNGFQAELRAAIDDTDPPARAPSLPPLEAVAREPADEPRAAEPRADDDPTGDGGDARAAS